MDCCRRFSEKSMPSWPNNQPGCLIAGFLRSACSPSPPDFGPNANGDALAIWHALMADKNGIATKKERTRQMWSLNRPTWFIRALFQQSPCLFDRILRSNSWRPRHAMRAFAYARLHGPPSTANTLRLSEAGSDPDEFRAKYCHRSPQYDCLNVLASA